VCSSDLFYSKDKNIKCKYCGEIIKDFFYLCETDDSKILCSNCQANINMSRLCNHDKIGEHRHIKVWIITAA